MNKNWACLSKRPKRYHLLTEPLPSTGNLRYTGRKANALPGYDPIKNGVLDQDEIYGLITRYLVDEYPFQRHYGTGMMGARPIKVAHRINETSGTINAIPDHNRRIALVER